MFLILIATHSCLCHHTATRSYIQGLLININSIYIKLFQSESNSTYHLNGLSVTMAAGNFEKLVWEIFSHSYFSDLPRGRCFGEGQGSQKTLFITATSTRVHLPSLPQDTRHCLRECYKSNAFMFVVVVIVDS
mgnify:CR=1 FL=1